VNIPSISMPFLCSEGSGPKLRLVLILDERGVHRYGQAVIDDLLRANFVQIVARLRLSTAAHRRRTRRSSGLVFSLFCRYVESRYHEAPDPCEMVDCVTTLAGTEPNSMEIPTEQLDDTAPSNLTSRLRELNPDIVVDLSSAALRGEFCAIPRYGFWRFHFGDSRKYPNGSGFLREIIDGEALTAVELHDIATDQALDYVLCRGEFSTSPYPSRLMNRFGPVWSAQHFVIQQLWKLHTLGPSRVRRLVHSTGVRVAGEDGSLPSDGSIATWLSRKVARRLRRGGKVENQALIWRLALRQSAVPLHANTSRDALGKFQWLPTARGHSWADPRLFRDGSANWLFFEQWQNNITKGEIWCGLLERGGSLTEVRPCLRQSYHLSYPQILEEQGEIYLIPESEEAGGVDLYRARKFPYDWVFERRLIEFPCVDPTVFRSRDRWWMIVSPQCVRGVAAISWLFSAPRITGPWLVHPAGPVAASAENARGAGPIFSYESTMIRPSQDCGLSYGRALIFNEILSLDDENYAETAIARVDAGWKPGLAGVHTYSRLNDWEVIDGGFTADGEESLFCVAERAGRAGGRI
jgi:hypothetical protein